MKNIQKFSQIQELKYYLVLMTKTAGSVLVQLLFGEIHRKNLSNLNFLKLSKLFPIKNIFPI
ncbi:hypothetical protein EBU02_07075 [bacterium]|nr:hypothetical protein [bacterium]